MLTCERCGKPAALEIRAVASTLDGAQTFEALDGSALNLPVAFSVGFCLACIALLQTSVLTMRAGCVQEVLPS